MKYDIIYSDPPWQYGSRGARSGQFADLDYPTMSIKELKELPVKNIVADNAALFMWVTSPFIDKAPEVANAWGFDHYVRVDKVWVKKTVNGARHAVCGPWGMTDAEFILLFTRGSICGQQRERNQPTVVEAVYPGMHSKKPDLFRDMITRRFPSSMSRLEMFARVETPGWQVFGNQVDNSVEIK